MPTVSYIVSAYNRPRALRGCLASIQVQTDQDFEVIVADRADDAKIASEQFLIVREMRDDRFSYVNASQLMPHWGQNCLYFATWLVENGRTTGEFLCFPSDDSYYMPVFQQACVQAAKANNWQVVWPEMLYDRRMAGVYAPLDARPCIGGIDKTGFLLRRDAWIGFPLGRGRDDLADGDMIVDLVGRGVPYGKVEEILCVHN